MGRLRRAYMWATGSIVWRLAAGRRRLLSAFARAEHGSALDMLAAVATTRRRDLRRKYFRHAMDEWRHAGIFRARAAAQGRLDAAEAGREEAGLLLEHGIVGGRTLFERLGEEDFLAFVYVAEADAVEQFDVYRAHGMPDPDTNTALDSILKDEAFHVSYSRQELLRMAGPDAAADRLPAVRTARWNRVKEAWLRLSRDIGTVVGGLWLTLLYVLVVAPFRLIARLEPGGLQAPQADPRPALARARSEA